VNTALSNPPGNQEKSQFEALIKKGQDTSPSTTNKSATNTAEQQPSTEVGSPIMSLTHLHSSQKNMNLAFGCTLANPSDLVFSNKIRATVKRETHERDGVVSSISWSRIVHCTESKRLLRFLP
jgi:hypothetical protein